MPLTWDSFYGDDFPPAVDHQDPVQHWLLVPSPAETRERADAQQRLTVAYVFHFADEAKLRAFRTHFQPNEDTPGRAEVYFPDGIEPQPVLGASERMTVGFAQLQDLDEIFAYMQENASGEVFLTGIEIQGASGIEAPRFEDVPLPNDRLIAVIDTDIAFANERFRKDRLRTRFAALWDQNGVASAQERLFLGRALNANGIDGWLERFDQNGNVDEPALYTQYFAETYPPDAYPRLPVSLGHGTHVLDLITGGEPDGPPILAVNLRNRAVDATHGLLLFPWLILALLWILTLTGSARTSPKAQLNFSFGGIAGRHDGQGPIEMVLDALVGSGRLSAVTLPAGNFYDTQTHARVTGADLDGGLSLDWIVQPDDGSSNILEIWLPVGDDDTPLIDVTVSPPSGPRRTFADTELGIWELADGAEVQARVYVQRVATFGAQARTRITVIGRHTAIDRDYFQYRGGLPQLAGPWKIELARTGLGAEQSVDLWIERDDQLGQARNGARQSYFRTDRAVWPRNAPPGLPVTNANTLSDIATGAKSLVLSGAYRNVRQVPGYSSMGSGDPDPRIPTAAAVCDDSRVHRGVLAAGFYSGSTRAMNGTSAASGVGGRLVSTRLEQARPVTRSAVETLATSDNGAEPPLTAPIDPPFGTYADLPKVRVGYGVLTTGWTRLPRFER